MVRRAGSRFGLRGGDVSRPKPEHSDDCHYTRRWHCALDCHHDAVEEALDADRAHSAGLLRALANDDMPERVERKLDELADRIERGES